MLLNSSEKPYRFVRTSNLWHVQIPIYRLGRRIRNLNTSIFENVEGSGRLSKAADERW